MLVLPRLSHARRAPRTSLQLDRLCFKRLLVARPDVCHTSLLLSGSPTGRTLQPASDSVGDAEECYHQITTGAKNAQEEQEADEDDERVRLAMALIRAQCDQIRREEQEVGAFGSVEELSC